MTIAIVLAKFNRIQIAWKMSQWSTCSGFIKSCIAPSACLMTSSLMSSAFSRPNNDLHYKALERLHDNFIFASLLGRLLLWWGDICQNHAFTKLNYVFYIDLYMSNCVCIVRVAGEGLNILYFCTWFFILFP